MWSLVLALLCGAGLVAGAPQGPFSSRASSDLPMEHRGQEDPQPMDVLGEILDTIFQSEAASAVDDAAAKITSAVGGIVDNIGEFIVTQVKELPDTIDRVSETVGDAFKNHSNTVVIVVRGVENAVKNLTAKPGEVVTGIADRVSVAADQSQTHTSLKELEKSIRLAIARIGGVIVTNADDIDKVLADGIRRITQTGNKTEEAKPKTTDALQEPSAAENEVRSLKTR